MALSYLSVDKIHQVVLNIKSGGIWYSWSFSNRSDIPWTVITKASEILVVNAFSPDRKNVSGKSVLTFRAPLPGAFPIHSCDGHWIVIADSVDGSPPFVTAAASRPVVCRKVAIIGSIPPPGMSRPGQDQNPQHFRLKIFSTTVEIVTKILASETYIAKAAPLPDYIQKCEKRLKFTWPIMKVEYNFTDLNFI